ncbi:MAG TPA: FAD-dependent oxidoreductase [Polyangia bacterium]|jgi:FAD/FMN-containing dehydrogenase|nr:FAD-dependent oxidoreductase [Polyangia bacterium]
MTPVLLAGGRLTATFLSLVILVTGCATGPRATPRASAPPSSYTADRPCWPSAAEWQRLAARLDGKLEQPQSPVEPCRRDAASADCAAALHNLQNPFYIEDQPGGSQSTGWLDAWSAAPSAYAVAAESPNDVVAAVTFAREHGLRLVIKGTGHDYLGRSTAPGSLLVWTHKMRRVTLHDAFIPRGCGLAGVGATPGTPAVTLEAGVRWLEAYQEVTVKHHRYVQGGGCTSVGAAGGFLQGGGFGSWSRKYGIAAASLLEAEVVTADGTLRVANACQHQDLFWALRGGGGGTFGVVTKVTLRTHALPSSFGFVLGQITAKSDAAFKELLERFLRFYRESLHNETWGEQVRVRGDNSLQLSMSFLGMSADEAARVWQPLRAWVEGRPESFAITLNFLVLPGEKMWDDRFIKERLASAIMPDQRPGQPEGRYWWANNQEEVSTYWYAYQSRWVPLDRFEGEEARRFALALFEASRHWPFALHFNKGQAGASAETLAADRETAMNPAVYDAAALIIAAASGDGHPGVRGHEPDLTEGRVERARVTAAMKILRAATPRTGSYVNETDYFEPDWQHAFWGDNYEKLLQIKRKYDPRGLFTCHHCVGSEGQP